MMTKSKEGMQGMGESCHYSLKPIINLHWLVKYQQWLRTFNNDRRFLHLPEFQEFNN